MKKSQIQVAIDRIDAEIRELTMVRERLVDASESYKPKRKALRADSKRRRNGEGATTDSGNMTYPPA